KRSPDTMVPDMRDTVAFDPQEAAPEAWDRYHAYRRQSRAEKHPDEPVEPDDTAEVGMRFRDPRRYRAYHVVVEDGEVVAELRVDGTEPDSPEGETTRPLLDCSIYVLKDRRRRGIALGLGPLAVAIMEERGATVMTSGGVEDEPGHAFMRRLGAEPRLVER